MAQSAQPKSGLRIERVPVAKVKPAKYNPRKDLQPGDPEYEKLRTAEWRGDHSQSTLWKINKRDANDQESHGTQKPLECMARPIRNHEGDVYDPFVGSGTTMVAAENERRICYGMEIDPGYVAVILQRLTDMGLTPVLKAAPAHA